MRFSLRRAMSFSCTPVVVALLAMSLFGCENKHIGRPCTLDLPDDGGSSTTGAVTNVTGEVLACPSRICLQPGAELATDTGPFCTAECSTNDDCSDGELRGSAPDDKRCKKGFACGVATELGEFCCKKLCICLDFVAVKGAEIPEPASCMAGSGSTCHNVQ